MKKQVTLPVLGALLLAAASQGSANASGAVGSFLASCKAKGGIAAPGRTAADATANVERLAARIGFNGDQRAISTIPVPASDRHPQGAVACEPPASGGLLPKG
ncbi:MAG TPA: hypothetical protein VNI01_04595 [Elusimicrobiota bacterium]|nr:hypothetical protein [Elusimicrobiota bacterium]